MYIRGIFPFYWGAGASSGGGGVAVEGPTWAWTIHVAPIHVYAVRSEAIVVEPGGKWSNDPTLMPIGDADE